MTPLAKDKALDLVQRRAPEWTENQRRWRWMADSFEGGNRYRFADYRVPPDQPRADRTPWANYGIDPLTSVPIQMSYGQFVDRNLVPHKSETDEVGQSVYAMRLSRTPVPSTLSKVVRRHLSRIFSKEVKRSGPASVETWWEDCDGSGPKQGNVDRWVRKTVGPLLLVLGQLDLQFCHPATENGYEPRTRADERELDSNRCLASYILPENMVWWRLEEEGNDYEECLVLCRDDDDAIYYRHWTEEACTAYGRRGEFLPEKSFDHPYGRVPIKRVFDERKHRSRHVGQSRYETVAELQKAIYNGRSELILSDVLQSHPLLQCPEDYILPGETVITGPGNLTPMKKDGVGQYIGFQYVDAPKGAQAELRTHIQDYKDEALEDAALTKPAGMTSHGTVHQSGISKIVDQQDGYDYLAEIAETLADAEAIAAEMALLVLSSGNPSPSDVTSISVQYPREFELYSTEQLATVISQVQQSAAGAGELPLVETELLARLVTVALPGLDDATQAALRDEITANVAAKSTALETARAKAAAAPQTADPGNATLAGSGAGSGPSGTMTNAFPSPA